MLAKLEAAGDLPEGSTDRFGKMFGFRNRLVHLYDRVDEGFVFAILTQRLEDLDELARRYVDALERVSE